MAYRGSEDHCIKPPMKRGERLAVLVPVVVLGVEYEAITAGPVCGGKAVDQIARGISFGEDRLLMGTVGGAAGNHFRHHLPLPLGGQAENLKIVSGSGQYWQYTCCQDTRIDFTAQDNRRLSA